MARTIRGPGTATSDSIAARKRTGTVILPADSSANLQDVRLSNGELDFPPEVVQRVGMAALMAMRDATHAPAAGGLDRADGAQQFADGDVVDEEQDAQRRPTYAQQVGNVGRAIDSGAAGLAKAVTSYPTSSDGRGYGMIRVVHAAPAAAAPAPAAAVAAPPSPPQVQQQPAAAPATAAPVSSAASSAPERPAGFKPDHAGTKPRADVTRVGNSYSGVDVRGDITINGREPGGGYMRTAGPGLGMARSNPDAGGAGGFRPAQGIDWQTRQDQRNAQTGASSIVHGPARAQAAAEMQRLTGVQQQGLRNQGDRRAAIRAATEHAG